MSEWKCGRCGKEYEFDEFMKLPHIQAVPEDTNPKEQHGFVCVCSKCGYVFHKDKWRLRETIEIKVAGKIGKVDVSTVFLEMNHWGYWYETMLFQGEGSQVNFELSYQDRYKTKEEAEKNHNIIVQKLKDKKFTIFPETYSLILEEDNEETKEV